MIINYFTRWQEWQCVSQTSTHIHELSWYLNQVLTAELFTMTRSNEPAVATNMGKKTIDVYWKNHRELTQCMFFIRLHLKRYIDKYLKTKFHKMFFFAVRFIYFRTNNFKITMDIIRHEINKLLKINEYRIQLHFFSEATLHTVCCNIALMLAWRHGIEKDLAFVFDFAIFTNNFNYVFYISFLTSI